LSDVIFSREELSLLIKGIKYCLKPKLTGTDVLLLAVEINVAIESVSSYLKIKSNIRNDIGNELHGLSRGLEQGRRKPRTGEAQNMLKLIKTKIKDQNLTFTNADKGNWSF